MQMSPLTYWHTLFLSILSLIFLIGSILALRSDSKWSGMIILITVLTLTGFFGWISINQSVYHVELSRIDDHRLYQSEQLVITGVVKNVGEFPVANVIGTVKLVNAQGSNAKKASQFGQPTAFAEILGDDPSFKPQNIISEHVIVDYLNPGSSKSFTILMDYPPYFKNTSYEIEAKAN